MNKYLSLAAIILFAVSCSKDDDSKPDTCSDGILNGTETAIDCGGECKVCAEPTPNKTYYIKFKAGDTWKLYQVAEPGYQSCGQCACGYMPPLADDYSGIDICQEDNDWITGADIEGWNGDVINFTPPDVFPVASFSYAEDGKTYLSESASSQTSSKVSITSVVSEGTYLGASVYKVKGTFTCKVKNMDGSGSDISITEGEFTIRYTEDF